MPKVASKHLLVLCALVAGCAGAQGGGGGKEAASASGDGKKEERKPLTPAEIAERATPAIVSIRTPQGLGTGFLIKKDGWVVTNLHVIGGHDKVMVILPNKKAIPVVEVVNASIRHDLVVLRIEAEDLPVLKLGESDRVRPGDPIVAIGHPLGLEDTVSNGLVSAVRDLENITLLQISAPIAPGSSGGPLFNDQGEVIGVATAILSGGQNLNLGVPVKYVQELIAKPQPIPLAKFAALINAAAESTRTAARKERKIPNHPTSIWNGCDDAAIYLVYQGISEAVSVGAPLYNDRNFSACYHIYDGAAGDMERRLPKSCRGPKQALAEGRKRATKLNDPSKQAWALRDAFDGLLDALARKSR